MFGWNFIKTSYNCAIALHFVLEKSSRILKVIAINFFLVIRFLRKFPFNQVSIKVGNRFAPILATNRRQSPISNNGSKVVEFDLLKGLNLFERQCSHSETKDFSLDGELDDLSILELVLNRDSEQFTKVE